MLQNGVSHQSLVSILGSAKPTEEVSQDRGHGNNSIAVSSEIGPINQNSSWHPDKHVINDYTYQFLFLQS